MFEFILRSQENMWICSQFHLTVVGGVWYLQDLIWTFFFTSSRVICTLYKSVQYLIVTVLVNNKTLILVTNKTFLFFYFNYQKKPFLIIKVFMSIKTLSFLHLSFFYLIFKFNLIFFLNYQRLLLIVSFSEQ